MRTVATRKRKYAKANSLSLLLKIKKAEKILNNEIKKDQAKFEAVVFESRRMSALQKYLQSIHKKHPLPDDRFLKQSSGVNEKAVSSEQKSNNFFTQVLFQEITGEQIYIQSEIN